MLHPFKFNSCVLLQWCSAALRRFQVLPQLLGLMWQLRIDVAVQGAPAPQGILAWEYSEFWSTNVSWHALQCGEFAENSV